MSNVTNGKELPVGWENPPVYARYSVQLGKMLDERQISGTRLAPYLRNVDVQWEGINTTDLPEMDFSEEERERYALRKGDLLVCEGGEVGRTAEWNGELKECFFQKAIHRLRPITERDEPGFFRYFMRMGVDRGDFTLSTASTIQHLTAEKLRVVRYPAPPRDQQRAIVDYLDRETARLDALAAAKQRLLDLLAEKRRAVITRAVTRGLDPDTLMRDSGIPFPTKRLKHLVALRRSRNAERTRAQPYIGLEQIESWTGRLVNNDPVSDNGTTPSTANESKSLSNSFEIGDVLFGKLRPYLAKAWVAEFPGRCTTEALVMDPHSIEPRFLRDVCLSSAFIDAVDASTFGSRMPRAEWDFIGNMPVPAPGRGEQNAIADHLDRETARLDALMAKVRQAIDLVEERRAALIAAAVTGQLDVGSAS